MKQKLIALRQQRGEQIALMEANVSGSNEQERVAYNGAKTETERLAAEIADCETKQQLVELFHLGESFLDANCGLPLAQFRNQVIDQQARSNAGAPIRQHHAQVMDRSYGLSGAMTDALVARCSHTTPTEQARPWVERRLPDYAREILRNCGMESHGSDSRVVQLAMEGTSDLPNILSNFANKILLMSYDAVPSALKKICRASSVADFKTAYRLRLGEFPALEQVLEHGEVHHGPVMEAKASYSLATWGKILAITWQAIINDDLGAFATLARGAGQAAANMEADFLVSLLAGPAGLGPAMDDGHALFDNTYHSNLGGAAGISVVSVSDARAAMRQQKGVDGKTLVDAEPVYLITGAAQQTEAEMLHTALYAATLANVNPLTVLTPLIDPRIDSAISPKAWYLCADPGRIPTFEYAYLTGQGAGPEILTRVGFEVLGIQMRVTESFGAGVLDWRGIYKNPGVV